MPKHLFFLLTVLFLTMALTTSTLAQDMGDWEIHDMERPKPTVITPGTHPGLQETPVPPPSDAIVLFDGTDLSNWENQDGEAAGWNVENGYMETVPGEGYVFTKQEFGDVQLHVEFRTPEEIEGEGQGRGNSGVFLMGQYEVQVLDSYENETYADGQASAVYGQYPPLVNASRAPGQWQTYDIIWHRPRFNEDGSLDTPARVTVLHNGVLTQDNVVLTGPTGHHQRPPYEAHADKLPLGFQDHSNPIRFRNIWVRELE